MWRTTMEAKNARMEKGQAIAGTSNQIRRIDAQNYIVRSQSNNGEYQVSKVAGEWYCECPDHIYRQKNVSTSLQ